MAKNSKRKIPEDGIKVGFNDKTIDLPLDQIIQLKIIAPGMRTSPKFQQILASIREVGIIEPPVVSSTSHDAGKYILLDGHLRIEALKELGETKVTCLVSTDDETFTYNKHINRLSTVQEHRMIVKAVERGVPEEKIAQALNVNVASIVHKKNLLDGICEEAAELLKDKIVAGGVFPVLRKMVPFRQIECATLMNDSNVYSVPYASALLAATPKSKLTNPEKPKKIKGLDEEQMARMESEMASLEREFRLIEDTYSQDVMNLTLAKGYLGTLLENSKIVRYLAQNHPEILSQFQKISEMTSLGGKDLAA